MEEARQAPHLRPLSLQLAGKFYYHAMGYPACNETKAIDGCEYNTSVFGERLGGRDAAAGSAGWQRVQPCLLTDMGGHTHAHWCSARADAFAHGPFQPRRSAQNTRQPGQRVSPYNPHMPTLCNDPRCCKTARRVLGARSCFARKNMPGTKPGKPGTKPKRAGGAPPR